jgi:hypothetical protein
MPQTYRSGTDEAEKLFGYIDTRTEAQEMPKAKLPMSKEAPNSKPASFREAPMARHQHYLEAAGRLFPPFIGFYRLFGDAIWHRVTRDLPLKRSIRWIGTFWNALERLSTLRCRTGAEKPRAAGTRGFERNSPEFR